MNWSIMVKSTSMNIFHKIPPSPIYSIKNLLIWCCCSQYFLLDLHSWNDNTNFKKVNNVLPSKFSLVSALSSSWWKWSWGWERSRGIREWRWWGGMKIWIIQWWWNLCMDLKPNDGIHLWHFFFINPFDSKGFPQRFHEDLNKYNICSCPLEGV